MINELRGMRFKGEISFNLYNEPLLDSRLLGFISYARKNLPRSFLYINTNGDLLDLSMWKKLRQAGLDWANVTQYDGKINENILSLLDKLSPDEKKHIHAHLLDGIHNQGGLVKKSDTRTFPLKKFCKRPFYQMSVNYKGEVLICCVDYFGWVVVGRLDKESVPSLWKKKVFRRYRKKLFFKDRSSLKLCNVCDR